MNRLRWTLLVVALCAFSNFALGANPVVVQDSLFHRNLYESLNLPVNSNLELRHFLLDDRLRSMLDVPTLAAAMKIAAQSQLSDLEKSTLDDLPQMTGSLDQRAASATAQHPITIVVLPGIFGEFIKNRPFEEIISRDSQIKQDFAAAVDREMAADPANATDPSFDLQTFGPQNRSLKDLVAPGFIKDAQGEVIAKIVVLVTPAYSFETLGDTASRATIFNRRLQKYENLMHDENIVLLGYSRGTDFGLEMLSQAGAQSLPYLKQVRGFVSYSGVIFGSTTADATEINGNKSKIIWDGLKNLVNILKTAASEREIPDIFAHNMEAYGTFDALVVKNSAMDLKKLESAKTVVGESSPSAGLGLVAQMWRQLGMDQIGALNEHVEHFKYAVEQTMTGVAQLKTDVRTQWWSTHVLPPEITYYSLSAAMANPSESALAKTIYNSDVGYDDTLDDRQLQGAQSQYEQLTGISLNDSQVSVAQTMFLPNLIEQLNPANGRLRYVNLGILSTHHWGLALQVVNDMKDGKINPFPREAVLAAIAKTVAMDLPH